MTRPAGRAARQRRYPPRCRRRVPPAPRRRPAAADPSEASPAARKDRARRRTRRSRTPPYPRGGIGSGAMNFLTLLPMAFVMIAGPQILSAIFLATSEDWKRTSIAYITGAALSITLFVTLAYLLLNGAADQGASNDALYILVLALLLVLMLRTYLNRADAKVPGWMTKLQTATPRFAFLLGAALLGVFPTDILTSAAVGSYLA